MRNGVVKKRFKKPKESKKGEDKHGGSDKDGFKEDISSLVYWGKDKNLLITASWDRSMRIFDDNDVDEREGPMRSVINNKHKDAINFVDFRVEHEMTATASDDGTVVLYNHKSRRFEG